MIHIPPLSEVVIFGPIEGEGGIDSISITFVNAGSEVTELAMSLATAQGLADSLNEIL